MSVSTCVRCDFEACKEQLLFDPLLRSHERELPDGWLTVIPGNVQLHRAWHFCSYYCLDQWISLQRNGITQEPKNAPLQGDWYALDGVQKGDVKTLEDLILQDMLVRTEEFYRQHPELKIDWRFQLEPRFREESKP